MLLLLGLTFFSSMSFASTECSGEMMTPNYSCMNLMGGYDIRLSIIEFQTCENGKITELDRMCSLMIFGKNGDFTSIPESDLNITYNSERSTYDPEHSVGDLTFLYPTKVTASDETRNFSITLSNKLQPLPQNPLERHMPATFEVSDKSGKIIKRGNLSCSLFR
jgi:hypothetical protein